MVARHSAALGLAFAASGFAGLGYQVTWGRILARSFGASAPALATVLAVFMGGLGLGAWLAGRRADAWSVSRALQVCVGLEVLVAALGLLAPFTLGLGGDAYAWLAGGLGFGPLARGVARALTATLALGPATVAMGMSFPILMRVGERAGATARLAGMLQGANVVGAVLGAWVTGFVLLPELGDSLTSRICAAANVLAALVLLGPARRPTPAPAAPASREGRPPEMGLLLIAFSTGALVLGYEVVWSRVLLPLFVGTVYASSAMLGTVLLGLSLGAWIASAIGDRVPDPRTTFGLLAALAAALAALGLHFMPEIVRPAIRLLRDAPDRWLAEWALPTLLSAPVVLPPSVVAGVAFPIGLRAATEHRHVASASGWLLAANTLGSIVGALGVGLFGLGVLGARGSAVALALAAGGWALLTVRRRAFAAVAAVGIVGIALLVPQLDPRVFAGGVLMLPRGVQDRILATGLGARTYTQLEYAAEGPGTTVFVEETPVGRSVFIGGRPVASEQPDDLRNQYLLGHLPALLHGAPRRSLVVGLGAGTTAGALSLHGPVDVCELSPVVEGAARRFADLNHGVVDREGVRLIFEDGRTFLRARTETYDVISVDPVHPHVAGAAALYTEDYFRAVRRRLAPGGVAAHWLPLYQLSWGDVAGVLRAWREVFESGVVYLAGYDAVLLARPGHDALARASDLAEGFERARADLARVHLGTPARLAATASIGPDALRRLVADAPRLRDEHNWLEFTAATHVRASSPEPMRRLVEARRSSPPEASADERRAHASYTTYLQAFVSLWQGDRERADALVRRGLAEDPESAGLRWLAGEDSLGTP